MPAALREVAFRLVPRPGARPRSLPFVLAEGAPSLVVETSVTHLDEHGDVWRILHVYGAPADLAAARERFARYAPPFVVEKRVMAETRGRLVLWYKYRASEGGKPLSQTALAFRTLGRETVVSDRMQAGALTVRILCRGSAKVARYVEKARAMAGDDVEFRLLYVGAPRAVADARLTPEEEAVVVEAQTRGWFGVPRRTDVRAIAKAVGVSPSAVSYRLRTAEAKLVSAWMGGR